MKQHCAPADQLQVYVHKERAGTIMRTCRIVSAWVNAATYNYAMHSQLCRANAAHLDCVLVVHIKGYYGPQIPDIG